MNKVLLCSMLDDDYVNITSNVQWDGYYLPDHEICFLRISDPYKETALVLKDVYYLVNLWLLSNSKNIRLALDQF